MGRRAKEKQLVAQASRRKTVLQIDRVSRREVGEGPVKTGASRTVNPNSITGIGLLGAYGDHSDDDDDDEEKEEGEEQYWPAGDENCNVQTKDGTAAASTSSMEQNTEIDAKLADFFKEIESMDPDTTNSTVDSSAGSSKQPQEPVSSTTDNHATSDEGYGPESYMSYGENEGVMYPWQVCLDEGTSCYYYWNTQTNEVQWHPPVQEPAVPEAQTVQQDKAENPEDVQVTTWPDCKESKAQEVSQSENEEKLSEEVSEHSSREENSKEVSDDDLDGFQVVDSWEDQENEAEDSAEQKEASPSALDETTDTTPPLASRQNTEQLDGDSDDEFAAQLLEDTYEKGRKDVLVEDSMELSEDETVKREDDMEKESENLLPPEVFEHLKTLPVADKKETRPMNEEDETRHTNKEEEGYRLQILELSSVLSNKLDFLEVSRVGMSTLKILLIEMETRIADWREGALDSHHLVQKLLQADQQLKQYEESATPPGWTCHWDSSRTHGLQHVYPAKEGKQDPSVADKKQSRTPARTHKRYYYTHQVTGDAQWEYPSDDINRDTNDSSSSAAVHGAAVSAGASTQTNLPMWSIPGYVSMVQAPMIPVVMATVPVVSSTVSTDSYLNPPVPGTEGGSEAVPFTASFAEADEESPPPPPGTDDLPPLPPVESIVPPPPPPEPSDVAPPPPPGEEMTASPLDVSVRTPLPVVAGQTPVTTIVAKGTASVRSLVDYSDLDSESTSFPPPDVAAEMPQGTGTQLATAAQATTEAVVASPEAAGIKPKLKRKKKVSKVGSTLLSSKARKVSSLVQKWQSIKQQEEPNLDSSEDEEEQNDPVRQIEEWKKEQLLSGQAAFNPNFQEIKGDWRERIRQRQAKMKTGATVDQKDT